MNRDAKIKLMNLYKKANGIKVFIYILVGLTIFGVYNLFQDDVKTNTDTPVEHEHVSIDLGIPKIVNTDYYKNHLLDKNITAKELLSLDKEEYYVFFRKNDSYTTRVIETVLDAYTNKKESKTIYFYDVDLIDENTNIQNTINDREVKNPTSEKIRVRGLPMLYRITDGKAEVISGVENIIKELDLPTSY